MIQIGQFSESKGLNISNEDSVFAQAVGGSQAALAVADGMGGGPFADKASRLAIGSVERALKTTGILGPSIFEEISNLIKEFEEKRGVSGVATTLTMAFIEQNYCSAFHVGDCQGIHIRNAGIKRFTKDQTEGQHLIDQGVFSRDFIRDYPRRHILTSVVNSKKDYVIDSYRFEVEEKDRIVIVSDGVMRNIYLREILYYSSISNEITDFCERVRLEVLRRGVVDDYSMVAVQL